MLYRPRCVRGSFGGLKGAPGRCSADERSTSSSSGTLLLLDHLYPEELPVDGAGVAAACSRRVTCTKPRPWIRHVKAINQASIWSSSNNSGNSGGSKGAGKAAVADAAVAADGTGLAVKDEKADATAAPDSSMSSSSSKTRTAVAAKRTQWHQKGGMSTPPLCWTESMHSDFFLQSFPFESQHEHTLPADCLSVVGSVLPLIPPTVTSLFFGGVAAAESQPQMQLQQLHQKPTRLLLQSCAYTRAGATLFDSSGNGALWVSQFSWLVQQEPSSSSFVSIGQAVQGAMLLPERHTCIPAHIRKSLELLLLLPPHMREEVPRLLLQLAACSRALLQQAEAVEAELLLRQKQHLREHQHPDKRSNSSRGNWLSAAQLMNPEELFPGNPWLQQQQQQQRSGHTLGSCGIQLCCCLLPGSSRRGRGCGSSRCSCSFCYVEGRPVGSEEAEADTGGPVAATQSAGTATGTGPASDVATAAEGVASAAASITALGVAVEDEDSRKRGDESPGTSVKVEEVQQDTEAVAAAAGGEAAAGGQRFGEEEDMEWELDLALEDALEGVAADAAVDGAGAAGAEAVAAGRSDSDNEVFSDKCHMRQPAGGSSASTAVHGNTSINAESGGAPQQQLQRQASVSHAAGDLDQEFEFDDADVDEAHAAAAPAAHHPQQQQQQQQQLHAARSHPRSAAVESAAVAAAHDATGARGSGPQDGHTAVSSAVAAAVDGKPTGAAAAAAEHGFVQDMLWGEVPGSSSFLFAQALAALAWRETDATAGVEKASATSRNLQQDDHDRELLRERAAAAAAAAHEAEEAAAQRKELLAQLENSTSTALLANCEKKHQQELSLACGETQELLHRQQAKRFLLLLLVTPEVSRVGPSFAGLSPACVGAVQQQQKQQQPLPLHNRATRRMCLASPDDKNMSSSNDSSIITRSSSSCGLLFQWVDEWTTRRQQQLLQRQRQRLLRCFFIDLNDSSAALFTPAEGGAEEGDELIGTAAVGASAAAAAAKMAAAGTGASSEAGVGAASAAAAAAATSRAQLQKMRRRAKQEVLKIDKQRRIELVKQGKSAYELRALAAAEELSREYRTRTPLQEFLLTAAEYCGGRQRELLQRLNVSFDLDFDKRHLHQREHGAAARGGAPLLHVKAALQLYGVSPVAGRRARVAMLRFHRPDLRSGLASCSSRKRGAGAQAAERPWVILPPVRSELLRRTPEDSPVGPYRNGLGGAGDGLYGADTIGDYSGSSDSFHPSHCFYSPKDLTLSDDCPFAVFEYTEQQPFILNNPGMSVRVTRYVRPLSPPPQSSGANTQNSIKVERTRAEEARLQGSLGTFGGLRLVEQKEKAPSIFGAEVPLAPGEGQVMMECPLFSALVFPHPQNPQQPLGPEGRFNDPRRGDFLLIRRRTKEGWKHYLRPMLFPPEALAAYPTCFSGGGSRAMVLGSADNCCIYTVGQLQPKVEVPAPQSKKLLEERKLQSKAWALRFVRETGVSELKRVKDLMKSKFCPPVIEKEVAQLLKQLSPIAPHRLPVLSEAAITSIISPEAVCSLESSHAAWYRLKAVGIVSLTSPEGLSSACAFVEAEERRQQQAAATARRRLRQLQQQQQQRREALGLPSDDAPEAAAAEKQQLQQLVLQLSTSRAGRRYSPLIRFIEELLLSVPWQTTKECREVLQNKGSAQFLLTGFGDPSCGRGEGIALLKRGSRTRSSSSNPLAVQQSARRAAAGGIAGTVDDLRKLGMMELRARLLQYGLSDAVIRTLPRWDQVALVRQYRDGFGADDGGPKGRGGGARLPAEEYEARLAEILKRQQAALKADEPLVTDTEDEMQQTPPQQNPDVAAAQQQLQQHGVPGSEDVADALFAGCDDSDHEQADEAELEMRELQVLRDRQEARSQRPLTQEEQLRAEATVRAVPCLKWTRKRRQQAGDAFGSDRVILIYGAENIKAFITWRDQRLERKRQRQMNAVHSKEALAGKRICRACGRPGHIASNVNCPLYRGPKRLGSLLAEPAEKKKRRRRNGNDMDLLLVAETGLEGTGSLCSNNTRVLSPSGRRRRNENSSAVAGLSSDSSDSDDDVDVDEDVPRGDGRDSGDAAYDSAFDDDQLSDDAEEVARGGRSTKSAVSRSSRSLLQRKRGRNSGAGDLDAGSQQPIDALNVAFARVVNMLLQQQSFKPFVSRVDDRVAPGYSTIVKNPMFLRKVLSKCRERQYTSVAAFQADIDLIVSNCFLFNPPGTPSAWLRDRVLQLQQMAMQRLAEQPQIATYEAAMLQNPYQEQQQFYAYGAYDD